MDPSQGYLDAWERLAKLIQQGESFSGHERNCAYLNTRGPRFADVSAASGFDLDDDGRALALVDWDHDGDLDLWLTNRTGPRVRFLKSDVPKSGHWLALKLVGDPARKVNRDAVGARVEVHLDGTARAGPPQKLVQTVYAGDGFLSQSTKWLHFGLGPAARVEQIVVRWPGAAAETIPGVAADRRYEIRQGSLRAAPAVVREMAARLPASVAKAAPPSDHARIRLVQPPRVPNFAFVDLDGREAKLSDYVRGPVLVNLWATWCAPCLKELADLGAGDRTLSKLQVRVLALNVDGLSGQGIPTNTAAGRGRLARMLRDMKVGLPAGIASAEVVEALDSLRKAALYRHAPLPLPSSFLIDPARRLAVVYLGPVTVDQILADVADLDADARKTRQLAAPLPGQWFDQVFATNPIAVADVYLTDGHVEDAREYLAQYLAKDPGPPSQGATALDRTRNRRLADVHEMLGRIALLTGKPADAEMKFREALRFNEEHGDAQVGLARALAELGRFEEAAQRLADAGDTRAVDADVRLLAVGIVADLKGKTAEAMAAYRKVMENPSHVVNATNEARLPAWLYVIEQRKARDAVRAATLRLGWLYATSGDARLRNGGEAVRLVRGICEREGQADPEAWDVLAAALAESGDSPAAVAAADRAVALARGHRLAQESLAAITSRRGLYARGQKFRDPGRRAAKR